MGSFLVFPQTACSRRTSPEAHAAGDESMRLESVWQLGVSLKVARSRHAELLGTGPCICGSRKEAASA